MRILLIAPKCFPLEGAESIVNIKLLQAFSQYEDIQVDVVSRRHSKGVYPSDEIAAYHVRIGELCIVESYNKLNLKTAWQTFMCFLKFGSGFKGCVWAYVALPYVRRLIKKNHYDFILTKSSPSFLLGAFFRKAGIPWVASWNDPFPSGFYPAPYGRDNDHRPTFLETLMLRQMRKADYHIFPSHNLLEHMVSYLRVDKERCKVIPHAIIPDARGDDRLRVAEASNDFTLHIIHSGNLSSPRDPTSFFTAMDNILAEHPDYRIQVAIMGSVAQDVLPSKERFPYLNERFVCIAPVEYNHALSILTQYDLACIIEANTNVGKGVFLPTKVTDFLQMGIPVMSVSPREGVLHSMYREGSIGYFCDVSDISSIEREIIKAYDDFTHGGLKQGVVNPAFLPEGVVSSYRVIADCLK
ncbi:MAG: glycosyltransferase [Bacteroidales bacterium]|nr:glycosyltransferase [Bacteroidales bacterium]